MNKIRLFSLTALLAFAASLTLSCSGDDDGLPSNNLIDDGGSSSSTEDNTHNSSSSLSSSYEQGGESQSSSSIESSSSSDGDNQGGVSSSSLATAVSSSSVSDCSNDNTETHFCDTRDGRLYKYVQIGEQVWMAENLDYDVEGSKCYGEEGEVFLGRDVNNIPITKTLSNAEVQANCIIYGKLYDWATSMNLEPSCNTNDCENHINAKHRGICPSGWHIPSNSEWDELLRFVYDDTDGIHEADCRTDTTTTTGRHLKATNGWNNHNNRDGNGLDTYGFSALPGGGYLDGYFSDVGDYGRWWIATDASEEGYVNSGRAVSRIMYNYNQGCSTYNRISIKSRLRSVRCLKD